MISFLILCLLLISHQIRALVALSHDHKVELIQVLFRHGDRIPDEKEIYKSDPYIEIYKAEGLGQLTKIGLQREYKIGQMLRKRYDSFLNKYKPHEVYARTTDFDRTKMSLQMVLAGLYPPTNETSWSKEILWSPIPIHSVPVNFDVFRLNFDEICTNQKILYEKAENSFEIQNKLKKYEDFLNHLQNSTGVADKKLFTIFLIYSNLRSALSMGLPLPKWCSTQDYKKLEAISDLYNEASSFSLGLRKIKAGPMIYEFLRNIDRHEKAVNKKKLYLFSSHDVSISAVTRAHNFTGIPSIPDYGSALIIEKLRTKHNQTYIRMFLWTGTSEQLIPLKLDNCDTECLLSYYKKIVAPILPDEKINYCRSMQYECKKLND